MRVHNDATSWTENGEGLRSLVRPNSDQSTDRTEAGERGWERAIAAAGIVFCLVLAGAYIGLNGSQGSKQQLGGTRVGAHPATAIGVAGAKRLDLASTSSMNSSTLTPEINFGWARAELFASSRGLARNATRDYRSDGPLALSQWSLSGPWLSRSAYLESRGLDRLELRFDARDVYLFAESLDPAALLTVTVDGQPVADTADVIASRLRPGSGKYYHIASFAERGSRLLAIEAGGALRLFSVAFE
jgi:hypothetical protein